MDSVVPYTEKKDAHRAVTYKIVRAIEAGAGTYTMPWHGTSNDVGRPVNARTLKTYRGVNVLSLWIEALSQNFETGHWASYRQWRELGAQVHKGEKGTVVVFYKAREAPKEDEDKGARKPSRFLLRSSSVFNASQVDGWTPPAPQKRSEGERIEAVEWLVALSGAHIRHGASIACYIPAIDRIDMPRRSSFVGTKTSSATEAYYSVLFHELTHWTGHASRLKRDLSGRFGGSAYAMEELIAELGAAFLSADMGIANEPRKDHAAYVADWLQVLKNDRTGLMAAASRASVAAEFIARCAALKGYLEPPAH